MTMTVPTTVADYDGKSPGRTSVCSRNPRLVRRYYRVTGSAAHGRLKPLLVRTANSGDWIDVGSPSRSDSSNDDDDGADHVESGESGGAPAVDFLWENAPRHETKLYRDKVKCYSHLPNGTAILDSKWVLGRLLGSRNGTNKGSAGDPEELATLETHCFRGLSGFRAFCERVDLLRERKDEARRRTPHHFRDLVQSYDDSTATGKDVIFPNLWVVKDSQSNGAGGVWVVGPQNAAQFCCAQSRSSPLLEQHAYVAQRYAWPPVLYMGRKCHVRVYGLITSDGRAFCHERCFLHVANDEFTCDAATTTTTPASSQDDEQGPFADSVHITNCCANSHDCDKFAGEICAFLVDSEQEKHVENDTTVNLSKFFPSIKASVAAFAARTAPFLQGGQANRGFEYLGMDFILSYRQDQPVAYLLEVNAPPSQDTATNLSHAEDLHDEVIRDILTLWVYPSVSGAAENCGGWRCVFRSDGGVKKQLSSHGKGPTTTIVPSKAAMLNRIRWAIYERKQLAAEAKYDSDPVSSDDEHETADRFAKFAREFFPYFGGGAMSQKVFFENAGGTQVPSHVIDAVSTSLSSRHRAKIGADFAAAAKETLFTLLGASKENHSMFLSSNASTLLFFLAQRYVQSGLLKKEDEIIIGHDNHLANVQPWLDAARASGATVKWWDPLMDLQELLSSKTRIVAVAHASNILGQIIDLGSLRQIVEKATNGKGHVVVDGVAAAPHCFPEIDEIQVDWYVVSCHKLFGPHLGALCGAKRLSEQLLRSSDGASTNALQIGTVNYDACAGICGLGHYFAALSRHTRPREVRKGVESLTREQVKVAYRLIRSAEGPLVEKLLEGLERSKKVTIISAKVETRGRIPLVCFVHDVIASSVIVEMCSKGGVICRQGTFLCTDHLLRDRGVLNLKEGVVRFSLAHYNTTSEVDRALALLEAIPGWF